MFSKRWPILAALFMSINLFAQKTIVTKLEDLPTFTYDIPVKPSEFVQAENGFDDFSARVADDVQSVLDQYDIRDNSTLKGLYHTLLAKAMLDGDAVAALDLTHKRRTLEEKPAEKLLSGLTTQCIAEAWLEQNSTDPAVVRDSFREKLTSAMQDMPWDVVQDLVEQTKGMLEISNRNLYIGLLQAQLDPAWEKAGNISGDAADMLLRARGSLTRTEPFRADIIEIFDAYIQDHKIEKQDIWPERSVTFDGSEGYQPVLIGIWDSGVDAAVFGEQMWRNPKENFDGIDSDGNGFVDDVHGIAFNLEEYATPDLLYPLRKEQADKWPQMKDQMKGLQDLQAAIDSDEAKKLRQYMAGLPPSDINTFLEELMLFSVYLHGTHVAGIAIDGNPYARALGARVTFDYRQVPAPPSVEQARRAADNYMKTVKYFQDNGVRTVNMSWGWTFAEIEGMLEANGIGKDAQERREITREIFTIYKDGLYAALKSAPEILFVTAAGNEDSDVEFDQVIPSSFELPNLLVVGAVDQAGEETSFTSFGQQVRLHANGFEVESVVPGGSHMQASGTSMASPNVVNLIGKLLAIEPSLTPIELISLIEQGVDKSADGRILLINPRKSVEYLLKM